MKKFLLLKKKYVFIYLILLVSLVLTGETVLSQQVLTGVVTSADDRAPLPGVNIMLKGTTVGTVTDLNGNYTLRVTNLNDTVIYSYVGYRPQEIPINGQTIINVVLQVDAELLDEVVVIGYGTVKKDDLTGSVAVVTSEELTKTAASDFGKALQGRATGVLVTQNGNPASGATIKIRGIGSINSNDDPLIVIDGVISDKISSISPEDIESLQVLKDASATAIYGANGANGVIIITTKRGRPGKIDVNFSAYGRMNRKPKYYDIMDATQYSQFYDTLLVRNGQITEPAYSDRFRQYYYGEGWEKGTDWQKEILQKSYTQNYYLRVSGGSENTNFSLSTNYFNDKGILMNNLAERYSVRANTDFRIGKYINIGATMLVARRRTSGGSSGEFGAWTTSLYVSPLMRERVEDPDKGYYPLNAKEGWEGPQVPFDYVDEDGNSLVVNNTGWNDKGSPVAPLAVTDQNSFSHTILSSVYAEIKPFPWLTYRIYPSVDLSLNRSRSWVPAYDNGVRSVPQAELNESYGEGISLSLENQITITQSFNNHNFTLTGVNHARKGEWNGASIRAPGFIYEQLPVIDQSDYEQRVATGNSSPWAQNSYLARLLYDYNSKYLVTASIRRDGSSNFGPENKWGTFPSFSAAWKLNQDLLPTVDQITSLKLRVGWGKTGNAQIGSFRYQNLLGKQDEFSPVFGVNQTVAPALNEMYIVGNPLIKWEAADMTNIGVDMAAFGNRVLFSGEWYYKKQDDLLMQVPITWTLAKVSGGQVGKPWYNLGKIHNTGFEFNATYRKMEGKFNYNISGNLTTYKNVVDDIPDQIIDGNSITRESNTIRSLYAYVAERIVQEDDFDANGRYKYAKPSQGDPKPGDLMFRDLNRDGFINDLDQTIIGKTLPDLQYSINIDLYYMNLDFSVFLFGMQNAQVINFLRRNNESMAFQDLHHNKSADFAANYWTPENASTEYIRADLNDKNFNSRASSWWLEEASFLRVKDLQLGYSLPFTATNYLGISRARIYISAVNLLTITQYTGNDPESPINNGGFDSGAYPLPRSFTAGIQVDF